MVGLFLSGLLCRGFRVTLTNGRVICVRFIIVGVFVSHSLMVELFVSFFFIYFFYCPGFRVQITHGEVICVGFIHAGVIHMIDIHVRVIQNRASNDR